MKLIKTIPEFFKFRKSLSSSLSVGIIPTMGALHDGHISLISKARTQCDIIVSTIFVNPIQFNNPSDFEKYPQTLDSDIEKIKKSKPSDCQTMDIIFTPTSSEMYPNLNKMTRVSVDQMDDTIEGKCRPGHFTGVSTIVSKLFNITRPDYAYFGQKDAIQCILIKRLINEMNYPIELVIGDTLRERDGLAMSSRNARLTKEHRVVAPVIYKALQACEKEFRRNSDLNIGEMRKIVNDLLIHVKEITFEYLTMTNFEGDSIDKVDSTAILSIAVFLGDVRLIDNVILNKV